MIKDTLGEQLIGHISRDYTTTKARETILKKDKPEVVATAKTKKQKRSSTQR